MDWVDRMIEMAKDYAIKQGAYNVLKDGPARENMKIEAALSLIALRSALEAAQPKGAEPNPAQFN